MKWQEKVQKILDEKYPKLRAEICTPISFPEEKVKNYININMGSMIGIETVGQVDMCIKGALLDLKDLVENSLEEMNR